MTIDPRQPSPTQPSQDLDCPERLLVQELHHRVMNTMAVLSAALQIELRKFADPWATVGRCERLVAAHAELHRCLMLGDDAGPVALDEHIEELCLRLSEAVLGPLGLQCVARLDAGDASAVVAQRLGLVLCELMINAAKHGAPVRPGGVVEVELSRGAEGWTCVVRNGGRKIVAASAGGAGQRIAAALLRSLGGQLDIRIHETGAEATATIPHAPQPPVGRRSACDEAGALSPA
jgi:two-component sensor histidine kinase